MAPTKIMFIRHAEKPDAASAVRGVDERGKANPNQLSVRGWQRAGALVRFFAPAGGNCAHGIATPSVIFACKPYGAASSVRPFSTVSPLAAALGIPVNHEISKRAVPALLDAAPGLGGKRVPREEQLPHLIEVPPGAGAVEYPNEIETVLRPFVR